MVALRSDVAWASGNAASTLNIKTGDITLRGLGEGETDLRNGFWKHVAMICEAEWAVVAE